MKINQGFYGLGELLAFFGIGKSDLPKDLPTGDTTLLPTDTTDTDPPDDDLVTTFTK